MAKLSTGLRNRLAGIYTEKVTNGGFDSSTTGWTAVDGTLASVANGQSGNCLQITATSASVSKAYQNITCKVGHIYRVVTYHKKGTGASGKLMIGITTDEGSVYDSGDVTDETWTAFGQGGAVFFIATDTTHRITLQNNDTTNNGYTALFDSVSCTSMMKSIQDVMLKCFLDIYDGTQPSSPDLEPAGTLLCTYYSNNPTDTLGLTFGEAVNGVLSKSTGETWAGTAIATGTAKYWRLRTAGDSGALSYTDERIDGSIGMSGADMVMTPSTSITQGTVQVCNTFTITVPIGS
jgi:hypothetical protein